MVHIFRNITIDIRRKNNENRYDAFIDICNKHNYAFEEGENCIEILAYFNTTDVDNFFEEVDKREEELNNRINIGLSEKQKNVLNKVLDMLADANIGLCHDYENSGELCAFNSNNGKAYSCSKDYDMEDTFFDEDDVIGELYHIPYTHKDKEIYSFFCGGFAVKK